MREVVVSGNIVLDVLVRPVGEVPWGGTAMVESIEQHLGGNGSNTSYALGKLGIPVRLLGMVGRDPFGEIVLHELGRAGVQTEEIRRSDSPTAGSVVLVSANGNRAILHRLGASAEFDYAQESFARVIARAAHYHLGSPFGLPRLRPRQEAMLRRAKESGVTTSVDTHWDSNGLWLEELSPYLHYTDFLFVNEDEARMLTGTVVPEDVASILLDRGAATVVLKLGQRGCAVFGHGGPFRSPAFDVGVVDTTGAGDCFAGAFVAALQRGRNLHEAARFANAVGALAIQAIGAVEGLRSYEETEEWIRTARLKTVHEDD